MYYTGSKICETDIITPLMVLWYVPFTVLLLGVVLVLLLVVFYFC